MKGKDRRHRDRMSIREGIQVKNEKSKNREKSQGQHASRRNAFCSQQTFPFTSVVPQHSSVPALTEPPKCFVCSSRMIVLDPATVTCRDNYTLTRPPGL